jgi:uncharacterized membrane protein YphA (DoxX/SURF4 family)
MTGVIFAFLSGTELLSALKCLILLYIAVLFLQSGLDKITDRAGNRAYISSFFEKTFLHSAAPLLLAVVTVLEIAAGICSAAGLVFMAAGHGETLARTGLLLGAINILCLFTGMRIARDYAGAASITAYFIFLVAGMVVFG